jgi:hypothetical protein
LVAGFFTLDLPHIHLTIFSEVITMNIEGRRSMIIQILYSLFHLQELAWRQGALLPFAGALVACIAVYL